MTTLKDQIASDVSTVFLNTEEFAETWKQWPQGDQGRVTAVTVVPDYRTDFENAGTSRSTERGDEQVTRFEIYVPDSVTVTAKDVWLDESEHQYRTVEVGPLDGSMRRLTIQRNDIDHISRPGAGQLL